VYFQMMNLQVNFIHGCLNLELQFMLIYDNNNKHNKCTLLTYFYCFFPVKIFLAKPTNFNMSFVQ